MKNRGFLLITVLAILIMIGLGAAAVLQSVGSLTDLKSNNLKDVQAKYLTEAAMQYAIWQCRANAGVCASGSISEGGVTVPYTVTGPASGKYTIKANVTYNNV